MKNATYYIIQHRYGPVPEPHFKLKQIVANKTWTNDFVLFYYLIRRARL
jgi:hypothetical protein